VPAASTAIVGTRTSRFSLFLLVLVVAGPSLVGCGATSKSATNGGNPGGGTPVMAVTPSSASFGNVTVNTGATQTMKLSNTGTAELTISQAAITGAGFSMPGLSAPTTLAAGASMNFMVAFNPTSAAADSGSISIAGDASNSPMTILLSSTGVTSTTKLSPSVTSLNFGTVTDGTTATQDVKLTNAGNANVTISSASASGTEFSASGGTNVRPQATWTLQWPMVRPTTT
jgi:hypothetical protein